MAVESGTHLLSGPSPFDAAAGRVLSRLCEFRHQKYFCDLDVEVEGTVFTCHRLVLSCVSRYFCALAQRTEMVDSTASTHEMPEVGADLFSSFVDFAYEGRCVIAEHRLMALLLLAGRLDAPIFQAALVTRVVERLDASNWRDAWDFAEQHNLTQLAAGASAAAAKCLVEMSDEELTALEDSPRRLAIVKSARDGYLFNVHNVQGEPLVDACKSCRTALVRWLIACDASLINRSAPSTTFPLLEACYAGSSVITHLLLREGARVNQRDGDNCTSLFIASQEGHLECVRLVLDARANMDLVEINGASALWIACQHGHADVVQCLLGRGAGALVQRPRYEDGRMPLHAAASAGAHLVVAALLAAESPMNIDTTDRFGDTSLFLAFKEGWPLCMELLLDSGASFLTERIKILFLVRRGQEQQTGYERYLACNDLMEARLLARAAVTAGIEAFDAEARAARAAAPPIADARAEAWRWRSSATTNTRLQVRFFEDDACTRALWWGATVVEMLDGNRVRIKYDAMFQFRVSYSVVTFKDDSLLWDASEGVYLRYRCVPEIAGPSSAQSPTIVHGTVPSAEPSSTGLPPSDNVAAHAMAIARTEAIADTPHEISAPMAASSHAAKASRKRKRFSEASAAASAGSQSVRKRKRKPKPRCWWKRFRAQYVFLGSRIGL